MAAGNTAEHATMTAGCMALWPTWTRCSRLFRKLLCFSSSVSSSASSSSTSKVPLSFSAPSPASGLEKSTSTSPASTSSPVGEGRGVRSSSWTKDAVRRTACAQRARRVSKQVPQARRAGVTPTLRAPRVHGTDTNNLQWLGHTWARREPSAAMTGALMMPAVPPPWPWAPLAREPGAKCISPGSLASSRSRAQQAHTMYWCSMTKVYLPGTH